jgi:hypothetical protein
MNSNTLPAKAGGRQIGARGKRNVFVEQLFAKDTKNIKAFVTTVKRLAIGGDPDFAKLWLDRIAPVRRGALLRFSLPPVQNMTDVIAAYDGLLAAISQGHISSAEGVELASIIDKLRQAIDTKDLETRIAALESAEERRMS